jgi:uncharacterized phiE125 gp8 family phage protein
MSMAAWTLVTAPESEPVSLTDAKAQLRFSSFGMDAAIGAQVAAARTWVEEYTHRALLTQTWRLDASGFADRIWLPRASPGQSVVVKYYSTAGVLTTLATSVYRLQSASSPAHIELIDGQSWPDVALRADAVQITYVCGWETADDVPASLKHAILMLTSHFFENSAAVITGAIAVAVPMSAESLCAPFRVFHREPLEML